MPAFRSPCNLFHELFHELSAEHSGSLIVAVRPHSAVQRFLARLQLPGHWHLNVARHDAELTRLLRRAPDLFASRETALALSVIASRGIPPTDLSPSSPRDSVRLDLPRAGLSLIAEWGEASNAFRGFAALHTSGSTTLASCTRTGVNIKDAQLLLWQVCGDVIKRVIAGDAVDAIEAEVTIGAELMIEHSHAPPVLSRLCAGQSNLACFVPTEGFRAKPPQHPAGILSGSFAPLHAGHRRLRDAAESYLGTPVLYELPMINADKAPLDYLTIEERCRQFEDSPVLLTAAPTFVEKAQLFPGTVFVVGIDTAVRVLNARFYGCSQRALRKALARIRERQCRFLVAGRKMGRFQTLDDIYVPRAFAELFESLPESMFRHDISSTELRALKRKQPRDSE